MLAGYPLLAEGQFAPLYSGQLDSAPALPVEAALNYFVILHYILAGAGMYALARRFDLGRFASCSPRLSICSAVLWPRTSTI